MIVEIFGPPGVGKTTLARALTDRLRARGLGVKLAASYRPAEQPGLRPGLARGALPDALRRLARPGREVIASLRHGSGDAPEAAMARFLLRSLPPTSLLWSTRLRQYIWRLSRLWYDLDRDGRVVIFDQAFVQVICSLVLLGRATDDAHVAHLLDHVPHPDLLVRLEAPRDVLQGRLIDRQGRQGRIERLLEFDLDTNLRSIEVIDRLHGIAARQGRRTISVGCAEPRSLAEAVERLEREVLARLGAKAQAA